MSVMIQQSGKRCCGFGLIELMVAVVIGLVVVGGITSLLVATLRTNTDNMEMTRLTQDLRATAELVTRDLRRAGYWPNAVDDVGSGGTSNPFQAIGFNDNPSDGLDATCVLYRYDENENGTLEATEQRGFRYDADAQVIEAKTGGTDGCDDDTGDWEALTDNAADRFMEITNFRFTSMGGAPFESVSVTGRTFTIREVVINVEGRLADDPSVTRSVQSTIRVRNDHLN